MKHSTGPVVYDQLNMRSSCADYPSNAAHIDTAILSTIKQMDPKDSMQLQEVRIPSILVDCIMSQSRRQKGYEYCKMNQNKGRIDARNCQYRSGHSIVDGNDGIHPNMYHDSLRISVSEYPIRYALSHKSASRPIRRSQQEQSRLQMEDKMMIATETEYDQATWRMYNRIMKYRQKRPLPDSYYDEISSKMHGNKNNNESVDNMASDVTVTTSSTSSSPSSNSPKFAPIRHTSAIAHQGDDNNRNQFKVRGLPRMVSNEDGLLFHDANNNNNNDDDELEDDEYSEMMMFDLEL
jgi:hypothetical protein